MTDDLIFIFQFFLYFTKLDFPEVTRGEEEEEGRPPSEAPGRHIQPRLGGSRKLLVAEKQRRSSAAARRRRRRRGVGLLLRPRRESPPSRQRLRLVVSPGAAAAASAPSPAAPDGPAADQEPETELQAFLLTLLEDTLTEMTKVREREGAETAAVLVERTKSIRTAVGQVRQIRTRAMPAFQQRLRDRLGEMLGGTGIEPQRLVQEAAMLADRSDIGEEITRLEIHSGQLDQMLQKGGEVGKKMDFLLQEMNREANTMLSKTNGIGEQGLVLTEVALGIKADIEKIREQSLNLE